MYQWLAKLPFGQPLVYLYDMKINPNFRLRDIAGETIIVNQGTSDVDMTRIISLNTSAKLLFEAMAGKEFAIDDAAKLLVDTYEIEESQAVSDAAVWAQALKEQGIIEE